MSTKQVVTNILRSKQVKATDQRVAILEYMHGNFTHPSAEDIYKTLHKKMKGLSLATVYNTLERLVELRAVDKIVINEERAQYDLARTPHHHFFCTTCNALIDIEVTCPHAKTWVAGPHKIDEVHGYFKGTCANCLKNNK